TRLRTSSICAARPRRARTTRCSTRTSHCSDEGNRMSSDPTVTSAEAGEQPWLKFDWYPAGHELVPQGGKLGKLFVLKQGEVEIERDGVFVNAISQPGAIFGEMSL